MPGRNLGTFNRLYFLDQFQIYLNIEGKVLMYPPCPLAPTPVPPINNLQNRQDDAVLSKASSHGVEISGLICDVLGT